MPFKDPKARRLYHQTYMREYREKHPDIREKEKLYGVAYNKSERGSIIRKNWESSHPDRINKDKVRLRINTIFHYGESCACCSENRVQFLSIDHIDGVKPEKISLGKRLSGRTLYQWLKKNNYPKGFQTLCFNCNMARGFFGYCHEEDNEADSC